MKSKLFFSLVLLQLASIATFGNMDTCKYESRFAIAPYFSFKWIAGSNYIPAHGYNAQTPFSDIQFMGYSKHETAGGGFSLLYTLVRKSRYDLQLGLNYGFRSDQYSKDGVITTYYSWPTLEAVRIYNYQFHNLEFVVLPAYKFRLLNIALGVVYSPLTYKISNYDYEWVDAYLGDSHSFHKTIRAWAKNNLVLPTVQVSLPIRRYKIPFAVLASMQYSVGDKNEIYFNIGCRISLFNKQQKK